MSVFRIYQTPEPFSDLLLRADGGYLTGLWFAPSKFPARPGRDREETSCAVLEETCRWLELYFSGKPPALLPPYHLAQLTPFRREVLELLLTIPFGETVTYHALAQAIAAQRGVERMSPQAVGGAVGWNPICILIPCHRVVGAHGDLTGYRGGMENKIALLSHENHDMRSYFAPKRGR